MFHYFRTPEGDVAQVAVSADGMHFGDPVTTGLCGDNTSFFYNPFRKKMGIFHSHGSAFDPMVQPRPQLLRVRPLHGGRVVGE